MDKRFLGLAFYPAPILLPKDADMTKWAVVACDQFTSEPEYWEECDKVVGAAPSSLRLILPEAKLGGANVSSDIETINSNMKAYLEEGIFEEHPESIIYVERKQSDGLIRRGIIGMIDLEDYDFTPGNNSLIRATEGTVLERIPPRAAVRKDAPIELPHVMLLIDDKARSVIEPLMCSCDNKVYDFDLMQDGGHITGYKVSVEQQDQIAKALHELVKGTGLLFVVGDGNHSLASAKKVYEDEKAAAPEGAVLKSRYALVEVVNLYDEALNFEPIHRVMFDVNPQEVLEALATEYPGSYFGDGTDQVILYSCAQGSGAINIVNPPAMLAVDTLQRFIDKYLASHGGRVDYVHDDDTAIRLGSAENAIAFLLPAMDKGDLFPTVMTDGVLPRKTFSMGHARDKRYYLEARKIK